MPNTTTMMDNTQELVNLTGAACKADGWYGIDDGLHTVAIQVVNFTGRIYVEASLALYPSEDDWFAVPLTPSTPYLQFPLNPMKPTGSMETGGDTLSVGKSFKINAIWIRARLDRSYLENVLFAEDPNVLSLYGNVVKITLAR